LNDHFQNSPGSLLLLSDRESPFLAFLKPNKQRSALLLGVPKRLSELKDILVNEKQVHAHTKLNDLCKATFSVKTNKKNRLSFTSAH
jgi:hypothetical protein